ncbi:MAG: hypothetical protein RL385_139 [Pseudomonadota bacterium]|jgi:NhaA family Na+:H+ antiporter
MQRLGVRTKLLYVAPAFVAWAGVYAAGIHPTIAGVIVGLMTPVRAWLGADGFLDGVQHQLDALPQKGTDHLSRRELAETLHRVDAARREAVAPAESLIETLHPWVAFGIMPLFALANAGVTVAGADLDATSWRVIFGVTAGLILGKPVGVIVAIAVTLKFGLGTLPRGLGLRHVLVLGLVAGVGFTMALFVAQLAFSDAHLLGAAKLAVVAASGVAAVLSLGCGLLLLSNELPGGTATCADEAEGSTDL